MPVHCIPVVLIKFSWKLLSLVPQNKTNFSLIFDIQPLLSWKAEDDHHFSIISITWAIPTNLSWKSQSQSQSLLFHAPLAEQWFLIISWPLLYRQISRRGPEHIIIYIIVLQVFSAQLMYSFNSTKHCMLKFSVPSGYMDVNDSHLIK